MLAILGGVAYAEARKRATQAEEAPGSSGSGLPEEMSESTSLLTGSEGGVELTVQPRPRKASAEDARDSSRI